MSSCPASSDCAFRSAVEPSVVKKVRYASFYPYCNGSAYVDCALHARIVAGEPVTPNLLPDGSIGEYLDSATGVSRHFLVVEDSPIFAALAVNAIRAHFPSAEVTRYATFDDARGSLLSSDYHLIVCGYGVGGGRTAHDIRELTDAPIVVLTGRPGGIDAPRYSRVVEKSAGPDALVGAIKSCLA